MDLYYEENRSLNSTSFLLYRKMMTHFGVRINVVQMYIYNILYASVLVMDLVFKNRVLEVALLNTSLIRLVFIFCLTFAIFEDFSKWSTPIALKL